MIHRIWLGGRMPDDYQEFGRRWQELNPVDVWLWDEEAVLTHKWINRAVIDDLYRRDNGRGSVELFAQVADVVSYELLLEHGGVYVNCDIEPLRPLAELEAQYGTRWVAREDDVFVVGAAMAGEPGDPFYQDVVTSLRPRYFLNPNDEMNQTTGPRLLTDVWKRNPQGVVALPVTAFNGVHWSLIPPGGDASGFSPPEGAFGIHHWGHRRVGRTNIIP